MSRRAFLRGAAAGGVGLGFSVGTTAPTGAKGPNILFVIAEDMSCDLGAYGCRGVNTPVFDGLAKQGVLFRHAFCSSPSCCPSRSAILTGRHFWQLRGAARNYGGILSHEFIPYPQLLEQDGYSLESEGKVSGPFGNPDPGEKRARTRWEWAERAAPFWRWRGTDACHRHRGWRRGAGVAAGKRLDEAVVPPFLPNTRAVREDLLDYYARIEEFDRELGVELDALERAGQLENTIVIVTSDHGMSFPRGKASLYDSGTNVPLVVAWPGRFAGGRVIDDLVSLIDVAPTVLEAAGLRPPAEMGGRSLMDLLISGTSGSVDLTRDRVFFGLDQHAPDSTTEGPMRAVRTRDFLYIVNSRPGSRLFPGDASPSREAVRSEAGGPVLAWLAPRPVDELYRLKDDPFQLTNRAPMPELAETRKRLGEILVAALRDAGDPQAATVEKLIASLRDR